MNRIDRLTAILLRLQSQRYVKPKELIEDFNISERTVFRDMNALLEAGVPLFSEPNRGYTLVDGYKLPPIMFTKDEIASLLLSSKYAEQIADKSMLNDLSNALLKLRSVLPSETKEYIESIESRTHTITMHKSMINDDVIKKLQSAIASKKIVEIDYYSNHRKEHTKRTIYPLSLVHYLYQWHLFAHCELRKDIRDFRLDRIKEIRTTEKEFYGFGDFDVKNYIEENKQKPTSIVTIELENTLVNKFKSYFITEKMKIIEKRATHTLIEFESFHDKYTANWLTTFGNRCKIIAPESLKKAYIENLKSLLETYTKV